MARQTWTDRDRVGALQAYRETGSLREASKRVGVPHATLHLWARQQAQYTGPKGAVRLAESGKPSHWDYDPANVGSVAEAALLRVIARTSEVAATSEDLRGLSAAMRTLAEIVQDSAFGRNSGREQALSSIQLDATAALQSLSVADLRQMAGLPLDVTPDSERGEPDGPSA